MAKFIAFLLLVNTVISCNLRAENYHGKIGTEAFKKSECNLLEYTEDFADISWTSIKTSVENNKTLDPNGNPNADLIDMSESTELSRVYQVISDLDDGYYAFSLYIRALQGGFGKYAIGAHFRGQGKARQFRSRLTVINDSTWTRANLVIKVEGKGDLIVYPGYVRIKGSEMKKAYIWGAQLEKLDSYKSSIKPYKGSFVIK